MAEFIAVEGDQCSHGGGALIADGPSSLKKVKINGLPIIVHQSSGQIDDLLHPSTATATANGSSKVRCYGAPIHRNNDLRVCGALTIVTLQSKVRCG